MPSGVATTMALENGGSAPLFSKQRMLSSPATSYYDADGWRSEHKRLAKILLKLRSSTTLTHDVQSPLNLHTPIRLACCVRVLPRLSVVQAALLKPSTGKRKRRYPTRRSASPPMNSASDETNPRRGTYMPLPAIWGVCDTNENEVVVYEVFSGRRLMRIAAPKLNVRITTLVHAPFRGFMNRQLEVLPVYKPRDLLYIKESQLINTDYVWVGFADGAIRLFPADSRRISEWNRSERMQTGDLADLVFELPKYHNSSIIAIARSPCHDDGSADLATMDRLSSAVHYMTAASSSDSDTNREHLSLMCTASVDSCIAIWDVQRIYRSLEAMRLQRRESKSVPGHGRGGSVSLSYLSTSNISAYANEVICMDGYSGPNHQAFHVRSSCTMIKVRPLMKLKGDVVSFRTLQWVSTLVTTEGYTKLRNVAEMTRDGEEVHAPQLIKSRREVQQKTRFDRREEHRHELELTEEAMQELEAELEVLMPPLKAEPAQSMRVNLLVAGDDCGTVHIWNLDEELQRTAMSDETRSAGNTALDGRPKNCARNSRRSASSPRRAISPSVQMGPLDSPPPKQKKRVRKGGNVGSVGPSRMTKPTPTTGQHHPPRKQHSLHTPSSRNMASTSPESTSLMGSPSCGGISILSLPSRRNESLHESGNSLTCMSELQSLAFNRRSGGLRAESTLRMISDTDDTVISHFGSGTTPGSRALSMRTDGQSPTTTRASLPLNSSPERGGSSTAFCLPPSGRRTLPEPTPRTAAKSYPKRARRVKPKVAGDTLSLRGVSEPWPTCSDAIRRSESRSAMDSPERGASAGRGKSATRRNISCQSKAAAASHSTRSTRKQPPEQIVGHQRMTEVLCRSSKFRIAFTGNAAVTGMAVDVPPTITITLRRIPDPVPRLYSLLEEPSAEETRQRLLENEFDKLTEQKALFYALRQLQCYISVGGVVLLLSCVPQWKLADDDGMELFKNRCQQDDIVRRRTRLREFCPLGHIDMPAFEVHFRKMVLEAHSQPVTHLFLDHAHSQLWVSRHDGLMSVFSTITGRVVTRVPHPCASVALGPLPHKEWLAQQREYLRESQATDASAFTRLEWHKETLDYPPAHYVDVVPFCRRSQFAVVLVTEDTRDRYMQSDDVYRSRSSGWRFEERSLCLQAPLTVSVVEGRSDMSPSAISREKMFNDFALQLCWCRVHADRVRRMQKKTYETYFKGIGVNVGVVMRDLGEYSQRYLRRQCYDTWLRHTQQFRFQYIMRRQRLRRLEWMRLAVTALQNADQLRTLRRWYTRWYSVRTLSQAKRGKHVMQRLLEKVSGTSSTASQDRLMGLWRLRRSQGLFRRWRRCCDRRVQRRTSLTAISATSVSTTDRSHRGFGVSAVTAATRYSISDGSSHFEDHDALAQTRAFVREMEEAPSGFVTKHATAYNSMMTMMERLHECRTSIVSFVENGVSPDSVLDESWIPIVESAEYSAETDDDDGRRLAVLKCALLALLQGLLSTADSVIPRMRDPPVLAEVLSMLTGILLCFDYITAEPERRLRYWEAASSSPDGAVSCYSSKVCGDVVRPCTPTGLTRGAAWAGRQDGDSSGMSVAAYCSATEANRKGYVATPVMQVMEEFLHRAMADPEYAEIIQTITDGADNMEVLLFLIEDANRSPSRA